MILEWNDSLITGIKDIDAQHKELFESINKLSVYQCNEGQLWGAILLIQNYAYTHFDTEEKYMLENNYPDYKEHKKEHDKFIKDFKIIKSKLEETSIEYIKTDFIEFISNWIVNHYTDNDVKMAAFLKEINPNLIKK